MRLLAVLILAMVYPTCISILYFVVFPHADDTSLNRPMQAAFMLGKLVQFALPVVYLACWDRAELRAGVPHARGLSLGLAFGVVTGAATLALYYGVLRGDGPFASMGGKVHSFLSQQGFATRDRYIAFAAFYCVVHSLAEEYYWRWFVFGQLRRLIAWPWAALVSSLAFMSHHVILLDHYLPDYFWVGVMPLSLGVAVGGLAWAWLYQHSRSIYAAWLSHLLVDAAIMVVGYDLLAPYF